VDGGAEFGVGGIADGAVSLPENVPVGSAEEEVGVVGSGEVDQFFPLVLMIEERDEMSMLGGRNVFAHTMDDGAADERRSALQFRELIHGDLGIVGRKVDLEAFAPGGRLLAAFVGEADGEDKVLGVAGFGEDNFGVVEGFTLDRRDDLGVQKRYGEKSERKN